MIFSLLSESVKCNLERRKLYSDLVRRAARGMAYTTDL
jgi:hypothetical protein